MTSEKNDPERTQKPDSFGCIYSVAFTIRHSLHYGAWNHVGSILKLLHTGGYCEVGVLSMFGRWGDRKGGRTGSAGRSLLERHFRSCATLLIVSGCLDKDRVGEQASK